MTTTTEYHNEGVEVRDGRLLVIRFEDDDAGVVRHFEGLPPVEAVVELRRVLRVGAWAVESAPTAQTFRDVADDAAKARDEMRAMVDGAKKSAEEAIQQQADAIRRALTDEMAKFCSPDRTTSIPATVADKVKGVVDAAEKVMKEKLDAALTVAGEEAPLAQVMGKLNDVSTQLQVMMGKRDERRGSAFRKGDDYQRSVHEELSRIAEVHGDSAELVAYVEGEAGNKKGDVLVTLNSGLTRGRTIRLVFEAMDREAKGNVGARTDSVLQELNCARQNRLAACGVAVCSSPDLAVANGQRLRWLADLNFAAVFDKDGWDPLALEAVYCLAKFEALRVADDGVGAAVDLGRASQLVTRMKARVDDLTKLQSNLQDGQSAFLKANTLAESLRSDLQSDLLALQVILKAEPSQEQSAA